MSSLQALLQVGPSQDESTRVAPKVLRIASDIQGLDYASLLIVKELVEQRVQTTLRRFADIQAGIGGLAPEIEAVVDEIASRTSSIAEINLEEPRAQSAFAVRKRTAGLMREPAIVEASAHGRADLAALLASSEFATLSRAAKLCGISEQTIRIRVKNRKLFGVTGPGGTRSKYPIWQFSTTWGQGVLEKLLHAMPKKSGLEVYRFFTTPNPHLGRSGAVANPNIGSPSPLQLLGISADGYAESAPKPLEDAAVLTVLNLAQAFAAEGMDAA